MGDDLSDEDSEFLDKRDSSGPLLLQGLRKPLRAEDVLRAVPSKLLVDLLVSRYFAANDHSSGRSNFFLQLQDIHS
jgi:hypothetical protein